LSEDAPEQEWKIEPLCPPDKIERPLTITLLAEILDVSVICSTAFSPEGNELAIGSDKTLRIYNVNTDKFSLEYTFDSSDDRPTNHIRSIAWTADSRRVFCAGEDGKVRVFSVASQRLERIISVAKGEVFQVVISASLGYFATATDDGALTLFRLSDYAEIGKLTLEADPPLVVTSLAISADGQYIAGGYGDWYVRIWDFVTQKFVHAHCCHSMGVYAVKWLPNQPILVTASLDSTIKLWRWKAPPDPSLEPLSSLEGHSSYVLSIAVDPTGDVIVSGSKDLTARVSSVAAGAMLYRIKGHTNSIIAVDYNPKGNMFCTGSGDQSVKIWAIRGAGAAPDK
jgi:WD40 repeat protein